MKRHYMKKYFALWEDPPSDVIWFEAGEKWAEGLIEGNFFQRQARSWALSLVNPLFSLGMDFVLAHYRGKLKKYIGPNGIWVAVKLPVPPNMVPRVAAKKRNPSNMNTKDVMNHPPQPWVPVKWNIV